MPNCLKRIKWYESGCKNSNVLQIYKKGLEFAFVSDNYEQCHNFILCKDFLQDIVYSNINEKTINIFNFLYSPHKDPKICLKQLRLLVRNHSDKLFEKKLNNSIRFINELETSLRMKHTKLRVCENKTYLIQATRRWMKAPPMISLFVLMLRIGLMHNANKTAKKTLDDMLKNKIKPYQKKDAYLLKNSYLGFERIMKMGDRKIFYRDINKNYPNLSVDCIHNSTGILSYSNEIKTQEEGYVGIIPKWHLF